MNLCILAAVVGAILGTGCGMAAAATVDALDAADPMTWLTKTVCTDAANQPVVADPYYGCPAGYGIRKIQSGDPLPYHNAEQIGYQQRDAFPVSDPIDGVTRIIATFDYAPFDTFNLYDGTDGYDIYTVQNGWANIVNTSDGGGYGQTFYGVNPVSCTVGGGWVLFPESGFLNGGQANAAIADTYWEQSGEDFPGKCPSSYSTPQTTWSYQTGFKFGGVNGNPSKTMNTVISNHGFRSGSGFLANGHLEVFYFTREYGITRWEVWTPVQQKPSRTRECIVPNRIKYQGVTFVVQYCHDWSVYIPASTAAIPLWPIPNIGLLQNPHFDGPGGWAALGNLAWGTANSTASRDTANSSTGVAYLQIACGVGAQCNGFTNALSQDLPASRFPATGTYGFGVNARTEGTGSSGSIGVEIEQLDSSGNVLSSDATAAVVLNDNGTQPSSGEAQSVYLSSAFVAKTTMITLLPNVATIRFLIAPQTPQVTFDALDAWLAPYPVPPAP